MYPALTVLQAVKNKTEDILWVGSQGGIETALVERAQIPFKTIPSAGVHGIGLKTLPGNIWKLVQGFFQSIKILREFKPDVILYTGGYVAVPMAIAGIRIPSTLFVPDIEPALALKFLSRFTDNIAVSTEESESFYPTKKVVNTGYPTREEFQNWTKKSSRESLKINGNKPVLLVFGGSQGARSINRAIQSNLLDLLSRFEIIHVSGEGNWEEVQTYKSSIPDEMKADYHIFPYLHEQMGAAFSAADLIISRSGASILGELPLFGLPAILAPYPHAWNYQRINAQYLASRNAALVVEDQDMEMNLMPTINSVFDHPDKLKSMAAAMRALYRPDAAIKIGEVIINSIKKSGKGDNS